MAAHDAGAEQLREPEAELGGDVGVVRVVERDVNGLVHFNPRLWRVGYSKATSRVAVPLASTVTVISFSPSTSCHTFTL